MKLKLSCIECGISKEKDKDVKKYSFELRDDNTYTFKCENGHESVIFFESHKFELLFEMGVYAMNDGYFREAVSNFAASIERFHEFSIEVFIQSILSIENAETSNYNVWTQQDKHEQYDKTWKMISNQSERQLGAYTMLYLSVFRCAPELIKNKHIEFRNKVIHKGYFPTEQETLNYAEEMFSYLKLKLIELKENMDVYLTYIYERKMREYISIEDINGKYLVKWSEYLTFRALKTIGEIKALDFKKVIDHRKDGYNPFKN